jgi:hypothetical protein
MWMLGDTYSLSDTLPDSTMDGAADMELTHHQPFNSMVSLTGELVHLECIIQKKLSIDLCLTKHNTMRI